MDRRPLPRRDDRLFGRGGYWDVSKRPLQILVFLLPLIIAYELGLALLLRTDAGVLTNAAHLRLIEFFEAFGIGATRGLYLGGIVIVVVLLAWHVLTREPWRVSWRAAGLMAIESMVLVMPLIVVGQFIVRFAGAGEAAPDVDHATMAAMFPATALAGSAQQVSDLDVWSRLAISVGAGLYEELVFRMLLIAMLHTLLVDVVKASSGLSAVIAIAVSAAAFAYYHPLASASTGMFIPMVLFYFIAGAYFGAIYFVRGFGIVVAVHALYNIVMVTLAG
ncbi:MAG TPA: CPBP family glutamic-type intramembrane protease [Phycisphaerales bacterium]|nr:CPBP family glutamic-type intramembrane protease [Phycisphaerales bacterium]HRQ74478.1 CPBP family glutamic-type intramembrane protease [Phycisphaerales bacterium]